MGILSRLLGKNTPDPARSPSPSGGSPGPATTGVAPEAPANQAAAPQAPTSGVATRDEAELAHWEESLRERAQVEFLTTTQPFERHGALATDIASEGFPVDRARAILREEWDRRVSWAGERADQDQSAAVRRAFAALTDSGVVALENLGFDNAEGHDLATGEARTAGATGYVFFHAQDASRLIGGPGTLHLRYAASRYESTTAEGKSAEDEAVGRQVVAALETERLPVSWDGRAHSTITIEGLQWYARPGPSSP